MDFRAALALIRPINCAMIGIAVLVGELVSRPPSGPILQSGLGFITGFMICAYSMAVNDVYDVEVDRVNQPSRPIPSGRLSAEAANRVAVVVLAAGVASSAATLNSVAVGLALLYAFLSWLYNSWGKKKGISGNLIVASSLAVPFIYGGVISGGAVGGSLLLMMATTSFLAGVGREVVKAMADTAGDEKRGVASIARVKGLRAASWVGAAFFIAAVITSWTPLTLRVSNQFYNFGVLVPDAVFVYLAFSILRSPDQQNAHKVKRLALGGMLAGLIVFIAGGF